MIKTYGFRHRYNSELLNRINEFHSFVGSRSNLLSIDFVINPMKSLIYEEKPYICYITLKINFGNETEIDEKYNELMSCKK